MACTLIPFYRIQFHIVLIHFRHLHHNIVSINGIVAYALVAVTAVIVVGVDSNKNTAQREPIVCRSSPPSCVRMLLMVVRIRLQCGWTFDYYFIAGPALLRSLQPFDFVVIVRICGSRKFIQSSVRLSVRPSIHLYFPCALDRCTPNIDNSTQSSVSMLLIAKQTRFVLAENPFLDAVVAGPNTNSSNKINRMRYSQARHCRTRFLCERE